MPAHRRPAVGTSLFARTVHGLEQVAEAELREQGCTVHAVTPRQLVLTAPAVLRPPRTVDDLFDLVLAVPDPGATKADLDALARALASAPLGVPPAPVLSVSASTAGRRTYSHLDVADAVGAVLASRLGAVYASRRDGAKPPPGAADWRVTIDASGVHIGLRGVRPPLHRRPWKVASVPGTLHPPVAAAMVRLAGIRAGDVVVDPCCGAGTLLAEAPPGTFRAGSDRAGVAAARTNAPDVPSFTADARALPYPTGSVDHVLTNPPWDRQVTSHGTFAEFVGEWRRVLRPGGRLTYLGPWDPPPGWRLVSRHPISLFGTRPVITVCAR
ncbi:methyltransferase domain-containing protein [Actinophytocola sp. NPDC049390]|uniref:methyltransferase domain-containing protein n=1 Tax=Actinophytocola sp. NPDC049390 TaxID=3363894 RepID=UPI00379B1A35